MQLLPPKKCDQIKTANNIIPFHPANPNIKKGQYHVALIGLMMYSIYIQRSNSIQVCFLLDFLYERYAF